MNTSKSVNLRKSADSDYAMSVVHIADPLPNHNASDGTKLIKPVTTSPYLSQMYRPAALKQDKRCIKVSAVSAVRYSKRHVPIGTVSAMAK
jgi:hypothetical protein